MPRPGVVSLSSRMVSVGGARKVSGTTSATASLMKAAGHGKIVTSSRGGGDRGPGNKGR